MTDQEKLIMQMYSSYQKKKAIIIATVVTFFVVVMSVVTFIVVFSPQYELKNDLVTIEYGTTYTPTVEDFVEMNESNSLENTFLEGNIPLIEGKEYADVGTYELTIVHKKPFVIRQKDLFTTTIRKTVQVCVVDTTQPIFSDNCPKELNILAIGEDEKKPNIAQHFAADDISGICEIYINDASVDYKTAGRYVVEVVAKDKYNNTTTMNCDIVVAEKELAIKNNNITLVEGDKTKIDIITNCNETVTYECDNTSICTVSDNGDVIAVKNGSCKVVVKCEELTAVCNVVVKAKPIKTEPKETTTQKQNVPTKTQTTTKPAKKDNYPEKDFLFKDGYTMENVTDVAYAYLKASGKAGSCIPLKNEEGIYIGMRVVFN